MSGLWCGSCGRGGMRAEAQKELAVMYKGEIVGNYFADLVVEDELVVELKCAERLAGEHTAQCLSYLKASGLFERFGETGLFAGEISEFEGGLEAGGLAVRVGRERIKAMSVAGYLVSRGSERRMRDELRDESGNDGLGIAVEGPVLAGEKPVELRLAEEAVAASQVDGEFYRSTREYDPVLKSHCRL